MRLDPWCAENLEQTKREIKELVDEHLDRDIIEEKYEIDDPSLIDVIYKELTGNKADTTEDSYEPEVSLYTEEEEEDEVEEESRDSEEEVEELDEVFEELNPEAPTYKWADNSLKLDSSVLVLWLGDRFIGHIEVDKSDPSHPWCWHLVNKNRLEIMQDIVLTEKEAKKALKEAFEKQKPVEDNDKVKEKDITFVWEKLNKNNEERKYGVEWFCYVDNKLIGYVEKNSNAKYPYCYGLRNCKLQYRSRGCSVLIRAKNGLEKVYIKREVQNSGAQGLLVGLSDSSLIARTLRKQRNDKILALVDLGKLTCEIADEIGCCVSTVKNVVKKLRPTESGTRNNFSSYALIGTLCNTDVQICKAAKLHNISCSNAHVVYNSCIENGIPVRKR